MIWSQKINSQERKVIGRKFNKRTNFKKHSTKLAVPIMASSFLGTLYNITDMAWIGLSWIKSSCRSWCRRHVSWFSQGLASMSRMGGQVQVAQCIDVETEKKPISMHRQQFSWQRLWTLFAAVMLLFLHPSGRILSVTRSRGIAGSIVLHKNSLWIDRFHF